MATTIAQTSPPAAEHERFGWPRATSLLALSLLLLSAGCGPDIAVDAKYRFVDFGDIAPGQSTRSNVRLSNFGADTMVHASVESGSPYFGIIGDDELLVAGADTGQLGVSFRGDDLGVQLGVLRLSWEGGELFLGLSGTVSEATGTIDDDPSPCATPGAEEICNGLDDDCDGALLPGETDDDHDGWLACEPGTGPLPAPLLGGGDCDDLDPQSHPLAPELCDERDNDCDGAPGEDEVDLDLDGALRCDGDCDDDHWQIRAGREEICDGVDDDCDGVTEPEEQDGDGDGWVPCASFTRLAFVELQGGEDCDDSDSLRFPGAQERCNGLDDDCDGAVPEVEQDQDGDGSRICDGDCDDLAADVGPLAAEICDGLDNDCDGSIPTEEGDPDGDGFSACAGDCGPDDATMWPGAMEVCDGLDNDCDGEFTAAEADADADGIANCAGDCEDLIDTVYPGAPEICDGQDNDCDGAMGPDELDGDNDNFAACDGDCAANDPLIFPGAEEICDGVDSDCDGALRPDEEDLDGDGFLACVNDCRDDLYDVHPGVAENSCDGLDNNCDGVTDPEVDAPLAVKGMASTTARAFRSNGAQGLGAAIGLTPPTWNHIVYGQVVADFDGNGWLDILIGHSDSWPDTVRTRLFTADCMGGYRATSLDSPTDGLVLDGLSVDLHTGADVDGDGDVDAIGWHFFTGEGHVWLNQGDGTSWQPVEPSDGPPFQLDLWGPEEIGASVAMPPIDVTSDGIVDLVECRTDDVASTDCRIHVGAGDGTFEIGASFSLDRIVTGFALADFDDDGEIDLLGGFDDDGDSGQAWLWSGFSATQLPSGGGVEAVDVNPLVESGGVDEQGRGWPYPVDWNEDGKMDLIISSMLAPEGTDRLIYIALGTGQGGFNSPQQISAVPHSLDARFAGIQDVIGVPILP